MIRETALFLLFAVAADVSLARPNTLSMSCAQASGLVASQGAAVLSTGPNSYDRYVANASFCLPGETLRRASAPTADGACQIGYVCRNRVQRNNK